MIKNKKLLAALGIFTLWLYGAWAGFEMLLNPMLKEATDNEYILLLLRDGVIKNLVWTLPAVLLIKHFSDGMLVGMRELFGFKKAASKYLLIVLPLAAFVLLGELIRTHTIEVSSVVNTGNPEGAQIAFAVAAITVGITKRFDNTLFREAETASAIVLHSFSSFKNLFVLCASSDTTFNSHD